MNESTIVCVIVLFDANALTARPFHNAWWKVLALASADWNVQILIPRVSFEEMVANAERDTDKLIRDLAMIANKAEGIPGFQAAQAGLRARRRAMRTKLTRDAEAVGAVLIDPVSHHPMEIVTRQTQRIKPCKESGDGYRDTLNWLTVLDIADSNPDQEVAWVSRDKDFAASEFAFHQELMDEADAAGVADRLSLWPSIDALVQNLLDQRDLDTDADAAHFALVVQAIQRYVSKEAPRMLIKNGNFSNDDIVMHPVPAEVAVEQPRANGTDWIFAVPVHAVIADGQKTHGSAAAGGIVTIDDYGKPLAGQITEVSWVPWTGNPSRVELSVLAQILEHWYEKLGPDQVAQLVWRFEKDDFRSSELLTLMSINERLQEVIFPGNLIEQFAEALIPADPNARARQEMHPADTPQMQKFLREQVQLIKFPASLHAQMRCFLAGLYL